MSDDPWAMWHRGGRWRHLVEGTIVPKSLVPAIGHVIVAFSRLDSQLDLTIAHLLVQANRELGRAIASAIPNYRPRIELFERIIRFKVVDEDDQKKLLRIASAIGAVADERHRLIHDYMSSLSGFDQINLSRKDVIFKKDSRRTTPITKESLKDLAGRMTDLSYRLQRFTKNDQRWKSGARFPWRNKPLARSR